MKNTAIQIKRAVSRLVDSGAHLSVASSTEFIAKKLGLSERWINYTHVEVRNRLNELEYKNTPYNERILFLPHCLRNSKECKATYTEEGLQCKGCGKCKLKDLIEMGKKRGYRACFVCPGGSMVQALIEKYKPKAVLGVCCFVEAQIAFENLKGKGIGVQAVLLSKAGCVDTDINLEEVREKMDLLEEKTEKNTSNKKEKK
ncbi:MAG: DUF116 domain-containing protein [Candidatus Diapherotrites archaeon]